MVLKDKIVLISVSATSSQEKAGALEELLLTLCDSLVKHQARVAYGGNLDKNGFTFLVEQRLADRHIGSKPAFIHIIDELTFAAGSFDRLEEILSSREKRVETRMCLDGNILTLGWRRGRLALDRGGVPAGTLDRGEFGAFQRRHATKPGAGYTNSRQAKAKIVDACVAIGGKTGILGNDADRYFGDYPGIAEEVFYTLNAGSPVVPVASLGGCAHAVALALNILREDAGFDVQHQAGFSEAMATLNAAADKIPEHVKEDLRLAAGSYPANVICKAVVNVISRWHASKPHGGLLSTAE